jgi:hypothetical protein
MTLMGNRWKWLSTSLTSVMLVLLNATPAMAHADHDIHRIAAGTTGTYEVDVWVEPVGASKDTILLTISANHLEGTGVADAVYVTSRLGEATSETVTAARTTSGYWQAVVPALSEGDTPLTVAVEGVEGGELRFTYTAPTSSWVMKQLVGLAAAHGFVVAWWLWSRRKRAFRPMEPAVSTTV